MYTLRLLGPPVLAGPTGPVSGRVAQERKLALLAVLALSEGRTLTRDSLAAMFWPESDQNRARHGVADSVWAIRSALGDEALLAQGNRLTLNRSVVGTDVEAFEAALRDGDQARAAELYPGRFMEGFHISGAPDFEHWLDREAARLEGAHAEALEELARDALEAGRATDAAMWARRLAEADPLNTRRALLCMEALAESGDPAGAILHGEGHVELLDTELGIPPPPEVEESIGRLRTTPTAGSPVRVGRRRAIAATPGPRSIGPPPPRPARRWRGAALAGAAAVGILLAWLIPGLTTGDAPDVVPDRIVVVSFENRTGDPELDLLGRLAADVLVRGLAQAGVGAVVLPEDMLGTGVGIEGGPRGPARAQALAGELGAGISVSGTIDPDPLGGLLVVTITSVPGSRVAAVPDPVPVDPEDPDLALERLSSRVVGTIAAHLGQDLPEHPFVVRTPSYEAYRAGDRATRLYLDQRFQEAGELFRRAYDLDPTAVGYLLWEAVAYWNVRDEPRVQDILEKIRPRRDELTPFDAAHVDWLEARLGGDLAAAVRASRVAHSLHPHSGLGGFQLGLDLMRVGEFDAALEAFLRLDPDRGWLSGFRYYWHDLAALYHLMGRHEDELAAAEEGHRRFPGEELLTARLRALAALGRIPELEGALRESTDPPAHFLAAAWALHRHGESALATAMAERGLEALAAAPLPLWSSAENRAARKETTALLLAAAGRLPEAREIFLELFEARPTDPDLLGWTGSVEARLGLEEDARARIRALEGLGQEPFARGRPTVARAAIHAELGDSPTLVRLLLEQSHREGRSLGPFHYTPHFDPVRDHPEVRGFFQFRR